MLKPVLLSAVVIFIAWTVATYLLLVAGVAFRGRRIRAIHRLGAWHLFGVRHLHPHAYTACFRLGVVRWRLPKSSCGRSHSWATRH